MRLKVLGGFRLVVLAVFAMVLQSTFSLAASALSDFELVSSTVNERSEGVELSDVIVEGNTVKNNITFHRLNDYANYRLTLKNNTNKDYKIVKINNDNSNPYIQYVYDDYAGVDFVANGTFEFDVKALYAVENTNLDARVQNTAVVFTITLSYVDDSEDSDDPISPDSDTEDIDVIISPDTGDKGIAFAISGAAVCLAVVLFVFTRFGLSRKIGVPVAVALLLVPAAAYAVTLHEVDGNLTIQNSISLMDKLKASYVVDGAENNVVINYGERLQVPATPEKEGYNFVSWLDSDGQAFDFSKNITDDIVLTANFEAKSYPVIFRYSGSRDDSYYLEKSVAYGSTLGADMPADPEDIDYDFDGWFLNGGDTAFTADTVINSAVIKNEDGREYVDVVGKWSRVDYEVTFNDVDDGGSSLKISVASGDNLNDYVDLKGDAKTGVYFVCWKKDLADTECYNFNLPVRESFTLYGYYATNSYSVSFVADGAENVPSPQVIEHGQKAVMPSQEPVKEHYDFDAWMLDGEEYDFDTPVTEDIVLEAEFLPKTYYVNFSYSGYKDGVNPDITNLPVDFGGSLGDAMPGDPSDTDYAFDGWFLNGGSIVFDGDTVITPGILSDGRVNVVGKWHRISRTVVFDAIAGGSYSVNVDSGDSLSDYADIKGDDVVGKTFDHWELNGEAYDFSAPVRSDITLHGVYTDNVYTVSFVADGATGVPDAQRVTHGQMATEPAGPSKAHYSFNCWKLNNACFDFSTPITSDIELVADYAPDSYTVKFRVDEVEQTALQQVVTYGNTATKPSDPEKTGHSFEYWALNGAEYDFSTAIETDITLDAVFKINTFTVTFDADGGVPTPSVATVNWGETVNVPTQPVKDNYTFDCWKKDGEASCFDFSTPITENMVLVADYTPGTYTVVLDKNDGTGTTVSRTVTYDEVVDLSVPSDFTRTGMAFRT